MNGVSPEIRRFATVSPIRGLLPGSCSDVMQAEQQHPSPRRDSLMRNITLAGVSLLCLSTNSWAEIDPQDIHIGVFRFTPTLELRDSYNDNYRGLSTNEQESRSPGISPTSLLSTGNRNSEDELQYYTDNHPYLTDAEARHTANPVRLRSIMELTNGHRLNWGLEYHR